MVTREMSNLLEAIPERVWLKDTHGVYLTCNTAFAQHFCATTAQSRRKADILIAIFAHAFHNL